MGGTGNRTSEIVDININRTRRMGYVFRNSSVNIVTDEGDILAFPCIALYERSTGLPVGYPQYERWYLPIEESLQKKSETLRKKAASIVVFLNYVLYRTRCNSLDELELGHIRSFLLYYKTTKNGTPRDPTEWERGIRDIFMFLFRYAQCNQGQGHLFACDFRDLIKITVIDSQKINRRAVVHEPKLMGVKGPDEKPRKNRYLMEGYLGFVLAAAAKYDPMILLGIALQAYGGLREGEVVNLTRSSMKLIYGGFGLCSKVEIDLTHDAQFFRQGSSQGHIKKKRTQLVYKDFIEDILRYVNEHDDLLRKKNCNENNDAPLFVNTWGKPMTVTTYCQRVKSLFYKYVIPAIHKLADKEGTWYEHAPFFELWEDRVDHETGEIIRGKYPGAHMFRHWFTMYLVTRNVKTETIAKLRGDKSPESMSQYIHVNAEIIDQFRTVNKSFQESVIEEII